MNTDEDIKKKSLWTNIALFMVGIVILVFMSLNKNDSQEAILQADSEIAQTLIENHVPEYALKLTENNHRLRSLQTFALINKTGDVEALTNFWLWNPTEKEQPEADIHNYVERPEANLEELITASR